MTEPDWLLPSLVIHIQACELLAEDGLTPKDGNVEANERVFVTCGGYNRCFSIRLWRFKPLQNYALRTLYPIGPETVTKCRCSALQSRQKSNGFKTAASKFVTGKPARQNLNLYYDKSIFW
ncbi:hypothetical protein IEQ34_017340 [Dendrobium chrysotoxum]|uniref:Uncharacterized protein n=1 Tax=Dendrobium chrysotoxum TaxID=161865 RepID=A0AAV7G979_DENCH|nr:hypothetical protein IEQ34_017340 [Dendrobium chrysotoxum]